MKAFTGIDIVHVPTFESSHAEGGLLMLSNLFHDTELSYARTPERRAGMFAAKEAIMKALGLPVGSWLTITILHEPSGKPYTEVVGMSDHCTLSISIAHHGEYAVACATGFYA